VSGGLVVDAREHAEQPPAPQHTHLMRDAIEGTQRSSEQPPAPQQTHLMRGAIKGTQHTHLMRDAIKGTQSSSHAPDEGRNQGHSELFTRTAPEPSHTVFRRVPEARSSCRAQA
jgi:hypothetical protein